jgi:hypothetical protein
MTLAEKVTIISKQQQSKAKQSKVSGSIHHK